MFISAIMRVPYTWAPGVTHLDCDISLDVDDNNTVLDIDELFFQPVRVGTESIVSHTYSLDEFDAFAIQEMIEFLLKHDWQFEYEDYVRGSYDNDSYEELLEGR